MPLWQILCLQSSSVQFLHVCSNTNYTMRAPSASLATSSYPTFPYQINKINLCCNFQRKIRVYRCVDLFLVERSFGFYNAFRKCYLRYSQSGGATVVCWLLNYASPSWVHDVQRAPAGSWTRNHAHMKAACYPLDHPEAQSFIILEFINSPVAVWFLLISRMLNVRILITWRRYWYSVKHGVEFMSLVHIFCTIESTNVISVYVHVSM